MAKGRPTQGGIIIKEARTRRRYSRTELAELTGFAINTIYNWERGLSRPAFDDVILIVETLHFSLMEIEGLRNAA